MRQPQVGAGRLLFLALAGVLAAPALQAGLTLYVASAFLAEFLTGGAVGPLSAVTAEALRSPGAAGDRYAARALRRRPPLVLVHGFTPDGKDDPRVVRAADLLARAGFEVTVPTVPGLTRGRLRPGDVEPVVAAVAATSRDAGRPVALLGVSIGAGPALLAAADPRVRDRVSAVLSLGGYASAHALVRFFVTGEYAFGQVRGRVVHDPEVVSAFVDANRDLVDADLAAALGSGDRAAAAAALDRLPPSVTAMLDALSPLAVADDIRARLVLVHDRSDPAVPYTETLRLAAARPARTQVVLVDLLDHVEGRPGVAWWHGARDAARLLGVFYGLLAGA